VLKQRRADREAHELNTMQELAKTLSKLTLVIAVKTGEANKMYGSVTAGTVADELKHQYDVSLDKRKIHLDKPIRALGEHEVELRLHPEVVSSLKVQVESSTPQPPTGEQPAVAAKEAAPAKDEPKKGETKKGATKKDEPKPGESATAEAKRELKKAPR
jgi:hypothetical protein